MALPPLTDTVLHDIPQEGLDEAIRDSVGARSGSTFRPMHKHCATAHSASARCLSVGVSSIVRASGISSAGVANPRRVASTISAPCACSTGRGNPRTRASFSTDFTGSRLMSTRISSFKNARGGTS